MHATRKVKLKQITPNLTCNLCDGYFIDATTIVECIHSFCRSCIVRHLEKYDYCPICEVQLHSSKPLSSIRSDAMLQEIVYKLVPGLFQNEMIQRRKFYGQHPELRPKSQQDSGQVYNESYITSDDMIHLSLEFDTGDMTKPRENSKRFILCPAAVSIGVLKKLIQGKYDLKSSSCIKILYRERYLPDDFLLMDIAYKYSWSQNGSGPLQLYYQVVGVPTAPFPFRHKPHLQPLCEKSNFDQQPENVEEDLKINTSHKISPADKSATPSGKRRGRPKRKSSLYVDEDEFKKQKITKLKTPKKSKMDGEAFNKPDSEVSSQGPEVQLRISESGVISAMSVSSGEERIINPISSPLKTSSTLVSNCREPLANGDQPRRNSNPIDFTTSAVILDSAIPLSKKIASSRMNNDKQQIQRGLRPELRFSPLEISSGNRNSSPPPTHHLLKVPTPKKWIQQSGCIIGDNMAQKPSPVKDRSTTSTNKSLPKKPPKFFKSRVSGQPAATNGYDTMLQDECAMSLTHSRNLSTSGIISTEDKLGGDHTVSENDVQDKTSGEAKDGGEKLTDTSILQTAHSPHHHPLDQPSYPCYGLHLDDNMNMGSVGLPMQFVPSLTMANGFCQFPYLSQNPAINPYLIAAMGMNLNPYFSYPYGNPISNAANLLNSPTKDTGTGNRKGNSLDLSITPNKPNKLGYIQISPKKSQSTPKKEKQGKAIPTGNISVTASSEKIDPKIGRQLSPTKGNTNTMPGANSEARTESFPTEELNHETEALELVVSSKGSMDTVPAGESDASDLDRDVVPDGYDDKVPHDVVTSSAVDSDAARVHGIREEVHGSTSDATLNENMLEQTTSATTEPEKSFASSPKVPEAQAPADEAKSVLPLPQTPSPGKSTSVLNNNNNVLLSSDLVDSTSSFPVTTITCSVTATTSA